MNNKENNQDSSKIAGKVYNVKDYVQQDTLSAGLAKTHEQVSDTFMEGEIGGVMEDVGGEDVKLRRKSLEEESK